MRFPILFLTLCLGLLSAAFADAGWLFGKSECNRRPVVAPVVQQIPVDQVVTVNDQPAKCFGGRCLPRQQEPQIPKAEVPPFEIPSADVDVSIGPAPVGDDVSLASIAAAVVGAVSAYFATKAADDPEDDDEKDPVPPV